MVLTFVNHRQLITLPVGPPLPFTVSSSRQRCDEVADVQTEGQIVKRGNGTKTQIRSMTSNLPHILRSLKQTRPNQTSNCQTPDPERRERIMCTGQRGFYICPCRNTQCPKKGIVPHRNITDGHVRHIEVDTLAWDMCEWWMTHGPVEHVLNRYLKPSCQYFAWFTLMKEDAEICAECQITCLERKEESGGSDKKIEGRKYGDGTTTMT
ncbi:hypothetical protein F66182_8076 [Fusarium sp. NRRL 66182]|nr:hypothetical protein F66182_8076 [Fusarium sp. NRRL 66182]